VSAIDTASACHTGYRHEALLYAGPEQFLAGTAPFIRAALAADEPVLVVLDATKIGALRGELDRDAERVLFADMAEVGANPARIIPAWQDFIDRHAAPGSRLWGIGEPIWAGRSPAELAECQRHEELLNVAFAEPAFSLLCPYDTDSLDRAVIDEAWRSHAFVREAGARSASPSFPGAAALAAPFDDPLPDPPPAAPVLALRPRDLREVRHWVAERAAAAGLPLERAGDLVLAVNEVITNSLTHGGGQGSVSVWQDGDGVICEVRDAGRITDPLAGRRRPAPDALGGRGLWIANQICELVQVRTSARGSVVRVHMRPRADSR
jgi:anti-sigma regulatory factor (Ser/Thr protein kinase)